MKHKRQIEAFSDPARFKFLLCGRRGGKTFGLTEKILERAWSCPPGGEIYYIGPTNQDAKDLIWENLEDRLDALGWSYKPYISKSRFELTNKRKIYIIGAEKIRRIRGHKVYFTALDEVAFFSEKLDTIWKAVRPSLNDLKGTAIWSTTPNGKGTEAYDFYLNILSKADEGWKFFHWNTEDNPFMDKDEIEAARRELDERSFMQEYLASWVSYEGLAYYCFDENLHIKPCKEFKFQNRSIFITLDFNVNPTTLLVGEEIGGIDYFRKEYSFRNSSTIETIRAFCEDFKQHKDKISIDIHGDSSGNSRASTTGYSDYHYIKEALTAEGFRFQLKIPGKNPAIIDRLAHTNSILKNYYGETRVNIDPSCKDLIRDLSSQELDGRHPSDRNNLGHKADAFGYRCWWKQVTAQRGTQGTVLL